MHVALHHCLDHDGHKTHGQYQTHKCQDHADHNGNDSKYRCTITISSAAIAVAVAIATVVNVTHAAAAIGATVGTTTIVQSAVISTVTPDAPIAIGCVTRLTTTYVFRSTKTDSDKAYDGKKSDHPHDVIGGLVVDGDATPTEQELSKSAADKTYFFCHLGVIACLWVSVA